MIYFLGSVYDAVDVNGWLYNYEGDGNDEGGGACGVL